MSIPLRTRWQGRVGAQLGERVAIQRASVMNGDGQVERERGAEALGLVGLVEAVLERLDEVRVALGREVEEG